MYFGSDKMSPIEMQKRKRAVKIADAINGIEGVPVSQYAIELSEKWVQGIITASQMKEMLLKVHKEA